MKSKNKVEKLVKYVSSKNYTKANDVLSEIVKEKIDERVEEVLAAQPKSE